MYAHSGRQCHHGGIVVRGSPKEEAKDLEERSGRGNPFGRVAHAHALRVCMLSLCVYLGMVLVSSSIFVR